MEPVQGAVWFAGEAVHETLWGTVGGAWESGARAADAVLRRLGGQKEPAPAEAEATLQHKPQRAHAEPRGQRRFQATPNIMRDEPR